MAELSKKVKQGVQGEEIMRLLFGEELAYFGEEGLEDSKEEYEIFKEIFYGTHDDDDDVKADEFTNPKPSLGGPILTRKYSMKDLPEQAQQGRNLSLKGTSTFDYFQESSSSCAGSSGRNVLGLQTGVSPTKILDQGSGHEHSFPDTSTNLVSSDLSNVVSDVVVKDPLLKPESSTMLLDQSKEGPDGSHPNTSAELVLLEPSNFVSDAPMIMKEPSHEIVPYSIVETLPSGVISTHNVLNNQGEMDSSGDVDDGVILKYKSSLQNKVVEGKSVTSPVSQESVASGLLPNSAHFAPKETSSALICANQGADGPTDVDITDPGLKLKRSVKRELPSRLESYAHRLLVDAGWKIESRTRNDRTKPARLFVNTDENERCKSLTLAWKACGRLLATSFDSALEENGREWWNAESFWQDLKDTLDRTDKEAPSHGSSMSLLNRWKLLDPFMAVVWIDKKIGVLNAGKALKALDSTTHIVEELNNKIMKEVGVKGAESDAKELSSCLISGLDQSILPPPQCSEGLNVHSSNKCVQADHKCCCCEDLQKKSNKSYARNRGEGLENVTCLCKGSISSGNQQKRSKAPCSKSNVQRDSYLLSDANGTKNLHDTEQAMSMSADDNSVQINMQSEMQSSANQVNQHEADNDFGKCSDINCNSVHQELSSGPEEAAKVVVNLESIKSQKKRTPAVKPDDVSTKKARKKSKRISEIGATEVSRNEVMTSLDDDSCREDPGIDDKTDEQCELGCQKTEINNIISESSSESLQQLEISPKYTNEVDPALRMEDLNVPGEVKTRKIPAKSLTKTARQGGKKKCDLIVSLEDKEHPLLNEDIEHHQLNDSEHKAKRSSLRESDSTVRKKQKVSSEVSVPQDELIDPEAAVVADSGNLSKELNGEGSYSANLLDITGVSPNPSKAIKSASKKKSGKTAFCKRINDDDLLITAFIKKKDYISKGKKRTPKLGASKSEALRKLKSQKGTCRLLPRILKKGGNHSMDGKKFTLGPRTVLCWLIEMGAVSLKDVIQYRNPKNDSVIKEGWVTVEGILCKCCTQIFSISDFKTHAGFKQQRPSLNLFLQSGRPYTLCQLQAWSTEFKRRKSNPQITNDDEMDQNDDTCGLCGDGGDLICCDNCPATYHQACLSTMEIPEGSWYCPKCTCIVCGHFVGGKETSSSLAMLECSQCEDKYHKTCIEGKVTCNGEIGSNTWFCGESCEKVYTGLRSRVGVLNCVDDGLSWSILRCSHDDQNVYSPQKIALMAECNAKLAISLTLMEECFLPMVDPRTGISMIPHVLYNLGSPFARLNYQGFYAVVLEKGDQLISVASIRVHGTTVAEMPLIATCSDHRRQGMCRLLLTAIEKMLISFNVKVLVLSAIPSLVETWSSGFGFKAIEDDEKQQLSNINLMLFPGTILLMKNLPEASAQESVENIDCCLRGEKSHLCETEVEIATTETGDHSVENPTSPCEKPSLSNTRAEQVNIHQEESQATSYKIGVSTRDSEHQRGSVATSNNNEIEHVLIDQVVAIHVDNTPAAHLGSTTCAPTSTIIGCSSIPSNTTNDVIIRNEDENLQQTIDIHSLDNVANAMNNEMSSEGDEAARVILRGDIHDEKVFFPEEQPEIAPQVAEQDDVPSTPSYNELQAVAASIEENTSANFDTLTEGCAVEAINNESIISSLGDQVEGKSESDVSEGNGSPSASLSDAGKFENASLSSPNLNEMNLGGKGDKEATADDCRTSKDEICGL